MTGPFADWPHLAGGGPTDEQLADVSDLYRRQAATHTLAAMDAELRHQYERVWLLELVGERDGRRVTYFSEDIGAPAGAEREAAEARLLRAGYRKEWAWTPVGGGWDGTGR